MFSTATPSAAPALLGTIGVLEIGALLSGLMDTGTIRHACFNGTLCAPFRAFALFEMSNDVSQLVSCVCIPSLIRYAAVVESDIDRRGNYTVTYTDYGESAELPSSALK